MKNIRTLSRKTKIWLASLIGVLVIAVIAGVSFFHQPTDEKDTAVSQEVQSLKATPSASAKSNTKKPTVTAEGSVEHIPNGTVSTEESQQLPGNTSNSNYPNDSQIDSINNTDNTGNTNNNDSYTEVQAYPNVTEKPPHRSGDVDSSQGTNYVLIGSDSRGGNNENIATDSVSGQRSDTTMVLHIAEDNSRIDVISIPRDTMVYLPSCNLSSGKHTEAQTAAMFNSAFSAGDSMSASIACTQRTIEANTGVRIDGYAVVDFAGFESVIDALGGVDIDVPQRMVSTKANLDVNAGKQHMDGKTALAYSRARIFEVGGGDGSDLSRIDRQQQVMEAVFHKLFSMNALEHPQETAEAMNKINDSALLSENLNNLMAQTQLAVQAKNAPLNFYTTPTVPYTYDANRVMWTQGALDMWANIHDDRKIG